MLHLSPAERARTRTIIAFHLPTERTVAKKNKWLAITHATETSTFANGTYMSDPIRYVSNLCADSPFIAVGGDCGGGHCKLGVTYLHAGKTRFAALLVYNGGDEYADLASLAEAGTSHFVGASAAYTSIFQILQHLIDSKNAFLNGDWLFINVILGLKNAAATHPCPICIVSDSSFLNSARYRKPGDKHSNNPLHSPLLRIASDRIIPTPLHVFLGLSNRIIMKVFPRLFGEQPVLAAVKRIKTVHSAGCGGLSDLWDLNGQEITKWVKKQCSARLLEASGAPTAARASHSILSDWLVKMHHSLLHAKEWTPSAIDDWRATVADIHQHWVAETEIAPFPKLHMLHHTVDFAERHRFLGLMSEAQMESYHASFNALYHQNNRNLANNIPERMRRCLARASTRAMRETLLSKPAESHSPA